MTRRVVEKLCTKKVCVDFLAPNRALGSLHGGIGFPYVPLTGPFLIVCRFPSIAPGNQDVLSTLRLKCYTKLRDLSTLQDFLGTVSPSQYDPSVAIEVLETAGWRERERERERERQKNLRERVRERR